MNTTIKLTREKVYFYYINNGNIGGLLGIGNEYSINDKIFAIIDGKLFMVINDELNSSYQLIDELIEI